jgi:AraC-like DNA-binding protein
MKLQIKNMVCRRCEMAVRAIVEKHGLTPVHVRLGEAEIAEHKIPDETFVALDADLRGIGFEILKEKRSKTIEEIKKTIVTIVQGKERENANLSGILAKKLGYDYNYLSNLFSEVEGQTIEKYYIAQRIEKAKELIVYNEMSLAEIADELGYSSAAYLSAQFKKVTGLTPGFFRKLKAGKREGIENL